MNNTIELCPCCGGWSTVDSGEHSTTIKCMDDNCGVRLTRFSLTGPHKESAVLAWNRRSDTRLAKAESFIRFTKRWDEYAARAYPKPVEIYGSENDYPEDETPADIYEGTKDRNE